MMVNPRFKLELGQWHHKVSTIYGKDTGNQKSNLSKCYSTILDDFLPQFFLFDIMGRRYRLLSTEWNGHNKLFK